MVVTKFCCESKSCGTRIPTYVLRTNGGPIQMTSNRKLALVMGKLDAEDAIELLRRGGCDPEMVPVRVTVS